MINEFQNYLLNIRGYSAMTAISYGKDLHDFANRMQAEHQGIRWSTITQQHIDEYVSQLKEEGKAATTINRRIASIRALYDWFKREGKDIENPARYTPRLKEAKTLPNTIDPQELKNAIDDSAGTLRIFLLLMAYGGLRAQECLDWNTQGIDTSDNSIRVHGKGMKERKVYLPEEIIKELKEYAEGRPARPFIGIEQRTLRRIIFYHLRRFSNAPQLSPHAIRHTYATQLAAKGASTLTIARQLGHEHQSTTEKYVNLAATDGCMQQYAMNLY